MPERVPDINLLPKYERQSTQQYHLFLIFVSTVVLSFLLLSVFYFTTKSKLTTAENNYEQLSEEADLLQAEIDGLETSEESSLADTVEFVEHSDIATSAFITHLQGLLPEKSYVDRYEYQNDQTKVLAHFETLPTVANYIAQLTDTDYLNDAKVEEISAIHDESEEISHYEAQFILNVNKQKLKKESKTDE